MTTASSHPPRLVGVRLALGILLGAFALPVQAQTPTVVQADRVHTSKPLREMPAAAGIYRQAPYVIPNKLQIFDNRPLPTVQEDFVDPVRDFGLPAGAAQRALLDVGQGTTLISFEGASQLDNLAVAGGGVAPPDPSGAIGPNHYVQMINLVTTVFDRAGNRVFGPVTGNSFFAGLGGTCETTNDGDPIVLYDAMADRWVVSQFAVTTGAERFCIAVSATPDPTSAYHQYAFPWTQFLDYPKLSVWPDGYYLTTNTFASGGGNFLYAEAVALERSQMLQGLPAQSIRFEVPDDIGGVLPADLDGPAPPAGTPGLIAGIDFYAGTNALREQIRLFALTANWATPSASTFTQIATIPTAPFNRRTADMPQPGTATMLDDLGDRLMFRLQYRNRGTHGTLLASHVVDTGVAGMRWYELRDGGTGTWDMFQQGTYAPADGLHRWMGSVSMNGAGDIGLAYSTSSATQFPSLHFTGQTADQSGTGLMNVGETLIHAGTGSQTNPSRWGDYSHLTVDPTDDATFWYTQEYYATNASFDFKTRIGQFSIELLPPPILTADADALSVTLADGATATRQVAVANQAAPGAATLRVSAAVANLDQPGAARPSAAGTRAPAPATPLPKGSLAADGTGTAALLGSGGPDDYGNTWADSNAPGGPAVAFQNIATTGTVLTFAGGSDDGQAAVTLPFAFPFYGTFRNSLLVSTNGYLTFGSSGDAFENVAIPNPASPNAIIAPLWDDLHKRTGTAYKGSLPDGRYVIQWSNWGSYAPTSGVSRTFQVILSPTAPSSSSTAP